MTGNTSSKNNQSSDFVQLQLEIKNEIYQFLPPEDVARLKRVAKPVKDTVEKYEENLFKKIAIILGVEQTKINAQDDANNKEQKRKQYLINLSSTEACLIFATKNFYNALSDEEKVLVGYRHHKTLAVILQNDNLLELYNRKTSLLYRSSADLPLHPWLEYILRTYLPGFSPIKLSEDTNNELTFTSQLLEAFFNIAPYTLGKAIFKNYSLVYHFKQLHQLRSMIDKYPKFFCKPMAFKRIAHRYEVEDLLFHIAEIHSQDTPLGKRALLTILNRLNNLLSSNNYMRRYFGKRTYIEEICARPALAYKIISNKRYEKKLPLRHRNRKKPSLLERITGMFAGMLIAGITGTFISLFSFPIGIAIVLVKAAKSEFSILPYNSASRFKKFFGFSIKCFLFALAALIALPLFLAVGLLCRVPGFFYDLVRGAHFGLNEGIKDILELLRTMVQEIWHSVEDEKKLGHIKWLFIWGMVPSQNWYTTDYTAPTIATEAAEYERQLHAQANQQNTESINIESNPDLTTASTANNSQSSVQYGKLFSLEKQNLSQSEYNEFYVPGARMFMR